MNKILKSSTLLLGSLLTLGTATVNAQKVIKLKVKEDKVPCTGVTQQECLVVKKGCFGKWENMYEPIKGFNHKAGTKYTIKAKQTERKGTIPADASKYSYDLVSIVKQKNVGGSSSTNSNNSVVIPTQKMMIKKVNGQALSSGKATTLTLDQKSGRYYGNSGCNNYSGEFTIKGNKITFGPAMSTMMACLDDDNKIMKEESMIHRVFENTLTIHQNGQNVVLKDDNNQDVMNLNIPTLEEQKAVLAKGSWKLVQLNNIGMDYKGANIRFDFTKNRASGNTGCNTFGGDFAINGSTINFGMMVSTMKACLDNEMKNTESQLLSVINNKNLTYDLTGKTLSLYDGERTVAIFIQD